MFPQDISQANSPITVSQLSSFLSVFFELHRAFSVKICYFVLCEVGGGEGKLLISSVSMIWTVLPEYFRLLTGFTTILGSGSLSLKGTPCKSPPHTPPKDLRNLESHSGYDHELGDERTSRPPNCHPDNKQPADLAQQVL